MRFFFSLTEIKIGASVCFFVCVNMRFIIYYNMNSNCNLKNKKRGLVKECE